MAFVIFETWSEGAALNEQWMQGIVNLHFWSTVLALSRYNFTAASVKAQS